MTKTVYNTHRRLWQQSNDRAGALKADPAAIPAACIAVPKNRRLNPKSPRSPTRKDSRSYILPILVLERPSRFPFRWIAPRRYAMRRPSRFGIPSRTASADARFGQQNALRPRRRLRKAAPRRRERQGRPGAPPFLPAGEKRRGKGRRHLQAAGFKEACPRLWERGSGARRKRSAPPEIQTF